MNRNLRIVICLAVALATLALLSGIWHPVQAENSVFGFTSTPTTNPEETEPPPTGEPTEEPPTVEPPTEQPPTEEPPTEEPPASTPKPERTRQEGEEPTIAPTATLPATPEATVTLAPTQVVTPEPPETGGALNPMTVMWVALLAGLGIVVLGQAVLRRVK